MKHLQFTRVLSFILALVLIFGIAPTVLAEEMPEITDIPMEKVAALPEEAAAELEHFSPITVDGSLSDYSNTVEIEPNNTFNTANIAKVGHSILGSTKSSDKYDIYQFTVSSKTEIILSSICNRQVMLFALFNQNGSRMEICTYYGRVDGWHVDRIERTLNPGTYYIQVQQAAFGGEAAYTSQLDYVLEIHAHKYSYTTPVLPTCTEQGYTIFACECGDYYTDKYVSPRHTYVPRSNGNGYRCCYCNHSPSASAFRIYGSDRIATSFSIASHLKGVTNQNKFSNIVVASASNFPDALTGSYLAAVKRAPILLTMPTAQPGIIAYIYNNLASGGTVYILGGTSAVPASFAEELAELGIYTKRLKGSDRYGTNLAILREAGVKSSQEVIICTGTGFADSLSASATGLPILLVGKTLTSEQINFLYGTSGRFTIIGGRGAVSTDVENQLRSIGIVTRIAGSSRYETSTLVAERYFPNAKRAVLAYAKNFPDGLCGGPLAYAMGAPLILTDSNYQSARNYTTSVGIYNGYVLGGSSLISDDVARRIFSLNGSASVLPG